MGRPLIRDAFLLAVGVLLGLTGCAADMATLQKRLEPHYRASRPQGSGPFPAILLVPGCGGVSPARLRTAEQLVGQGYAVVFVDYIASRGLQTACRGEVSVDEVAQDIRSVRATSARFPTSNRPESALLAGRGAARGCWRASLGQAPSSSRHSTPRRPSIQSVPG